MIDPPCTVMVNRILPEMKKRAAKILKEKGWKQERIAEKMGVSQPMVSRYLRNGEERFSAGIEEFIGGISGKLANMLESGEEDSEIIGEICGECFVLREKGELCGLHPVRECRVCMNLRGNAVTRERSEIVRDVELAAKMLGNINPMLIPEVRVNVARARDGAISKSEIVAIPGRLVEINGGLRALTAPEFGASSHLSLTLLDAMRVDGEIKAVVNILYFREMENVMERLEFKVSERMKKGTDVLIDRGGFGREPCAYVFGSSAKDAAEKVIRISEALS